jgi:DNA-binding transcriptional regulator PaaX
MSTNTKAIPDALSLTVLQILEHTAQGRERAISRGELVARVSHAICGVPERLVRRAIHELRRQGWLICSAPGEDGGYYMADSLAEFDEFIARELHPKAMDMLETENIMRQAARQKFGDAAQIGLL